MEDESITAKLWGFDGSCMELTKFVTLMRSVTDGLREEVCLKFLVSRIMMMISTARWEEGTIGEVTRAQNTGVHMRSEVFCWSLKD